MIYLVGEWYVSSPSFAGQTYYKKLLSPRYPSVSITPDNPQQALDSLDCIRTVTIRFGDDVTSENCTYKSAISRAFLDTFFTQITDEVQIAMLELALAYDER